MACSLVSPASRGIGLHLSRQLPQNTTIPVIATAKVDLCGTKEVLQELDGNFRDRPMVLEVDVSGISPFILFSWVDRS